MNIILPTTTFVEFQLNKECCHLLSKGVMTEIKMTAIMEVEPNRKIKINLVITDVISPDSKQEAHISHDINSTGVEKEISTGLARVNSFFHSYLGKSCWILTGYLEGADKVEFILAYYESVKLTVWTKKLPLEKQENFFPKEMMN